MQKYSTSTSRFFRKIIIGFLIFFVIFLSAFFIPLYKDKDFYQKVLIRKLNESINHKLKFDNYYIKFFPSPAILLNGVSIYHPNKKEYKIIQGENLRIKLSWTLLLFNQIKINEVLLSGGKMVVDDSILFTKKDTNLDQNAWEFKNILKKINIRKITLNNVQIQYKQLPQKTIHNIFASNLNLQLKPDQQNILNFTGKYFGSELEIHLVFEIGQNFEHTSLLGNVEVSNLPLHHFQKYLKIFRKMDFTHSILSGNFRLKKQIHSKVLSIEGDTNLLKLSEKKGRSYPKLTIASSLDLDFKKKEIIFYSIQASSTNILENGRAKGKVSFQKDIALDLNVTAKYTYIKPLLQLIIAIMSIDLPQTERNILANIQIHSNWIRYSSYNFSNCQGIVNVRNKNVSIDLKQAKIFSGSLTGLGRIDFENRTKYNFDVSIYDIDSSQFLSIYTNKPYITGNLSSRFYLNSFGETKQEFLRELNIQGNIKITNGELIGQADILKPIFALGKIVNILGPKGKNTGFQSITSDFVVRNRYIHIKNLRMKGVGLDAKGEGKVSFSKKINLRIVVGLGGIAGKLIKVPIISKGTLPDYNFYVDPVWIGSVYVAGFFGGPAGVAAGSAASEYVNKAWQGVKSIFKDQIWDKINPQKNK